MSPSLRATILAVATACAVAACGDLLPKKHANETAASAVEREAPDAQLLASVFESLDRMAQGTATQKAEILAQARATAEHSPGKAFDQLRYALLLALPGHGGSDPQAARVRLRELVLNTEVQAGLAHAVAALELQRLDHEFALLDDARRLTAEAERSERERITPLNRRLQTEIEENARLHRALDEAKAKLDAIMNIERSITERKPSGEVKSP